MPYTLSISEVRKRLPRIVREIQKSPDVVYHITVFNDVVAEIKAPGMIDKRGEAARRLLDLNRKRFRRTGKKKIDVSEHVDRYLYESQSHTS
jgi:hypothetical protein